MYLLICLRILETQNNYLSINMTQEDKKLLLRDLCARLPYSLYVRVEEFNVSKNEAITEGFIGNYLKDNRCNDYNADDILNELADDCIDVKPYLRPLSSMTEEEKLEYLELNGETVGDGILLYDWLNAHYFDYRLYNGKTMIELGLALPAPDGMYNLNK